MTASPQWEREGRAWPNRDSSRFVRAGGLCWHVQRAGTGPVILLLHGTGAATHSWRGLLPRLARRFTVVAPDLPGHGFTTLPTPNLLSLPGMSGLLGALLRVLELEPALAVGHSAGAAILARMALDARIAPAAIMALNGALLPLPSRSARLFPAAARLLAGLPPVPRLFAWRAGDRAVVERLLRETGSTLDAAGTALYARMARSPGHVAGALGMMAHWDLDALQQDLPDLRVPVTLVVGANDRMIPPAEAERLCTLLPNATLVRLPGTGHLAHEERPGTVARLIEAMAGRAGVTACAEQAGAA